MSEEKVRKDKLKEVVKGLKSDDNKEIIKSLRALKIYGDASASPQIFHLLLNHHDDEVGEEVMKLLASLKDTQMESILIDAVKNQKYKDIQQLLLSSMWQSGLNFSEHLLTLVEIALEGDFMVQVECVTIIENLEGPFQEEHIMESLLKLNNFFDQNVSDERKEKLMKELTIIIKDFQS